MTFKEGWLDRQLQSASKTVEAWPTTMREALSLKQGAYTCEGQKDAEISCSDQEEE